MPGGRKPTFQANASPNCVRNEQKHLVGYSELAWISREDLLLSPIVPSTQIPSLMGPPNYTEAVLWLFYS